MNATMSPLQPSKLPKREYDESFGVDDIEESENSLPTPPVSIKTEKPDHTPASSHKDSITSIETTKATQISPPTKNTAVAPSAFAALNSTGQPPAKKPKLTFAEKEEQRLNKEIKDAERTEERAKREADKKEKAEEKARKDAEKEAERLVKEFEREEKRKAAEAEKTAKEEKKRQKEEARKQKEEEKKRQDEEKKKKERSQPKLSSFFSQPNIRRASLSSRDSMSPAPGSSTIEQLTPTKPIETSFYDKQFPDFFVYPDVKLAPQNRFQRDTQALASLEEIIDNYTNGSRSPIKPSTWNASDLFHGYNATNRGIAVPSVKAIMSEMSGQASKPIDLTTDSQNSQIRKTKYLLKRVPVKYLKFQEDVRPSYIGTYTKRPVSSVSTLARNFKRRDLPETNYDYDSEAEWVEDEDAEDCDSNGDDEEDVDDVDDMDGFLDDDNDEGLNSRRMVLQGDLEPASTGLCWEDSHKRNTNLKMMQYRMEIILDGPFKSIDPFSTEYWEPPSKAQQGNMDPPRLPLHAVKANSANNVAAPKPVKPFFPGTTSSPTVPASTAPGSAKLPVKMITEDDMEEFKQEVTGSDLSKIGLVEVLKKKFPKQTGAAIKGTLETIAKRTGSKLADKRWVIIEEYQ